MPCPATRLHEGAIVYGCCRFSDTKSRAVDDYGFVADWIPCDCLRSAALESVGSHIGAAAQELWDQLLRPRGSSPLRDGMSYARDLQYQPRRGCCRDRLRRPQQLQPRFRTLERHAAKGLSPRTARAEPNPVQSERGTCKRAPRRLRQEMCIGRAANRQGLTRSPKPSSTINISNRLEYRARRDLKQRANKGARALPLDRWLAH